VAIRIYSQRLGMISDEQFQAALNRFHLGRFVQAEPVPFGLFGQNIFLSSDTGSFVLRGAPHFPWQFLTERFYVQQLHERTQVPVPWPYLLDSTGDIFGWSYVITPRMQGLQLEDPQVRKQLSKDDRQALARAFGENLALMQELRWPFSGRYNAQIDTVQPFEFRNELVWPFPVESDARIAQLSPTTISYAERVIALIRHLLAICQQYNDRTTNADITWVEGLLTDGHKALQEDFQPCFVMEDYKHGNMLVARKSGIWSVSGLFDLMEGHFGDGEADLSRIAAIYIDDDLQLAQEFISAYVSQRPPRPGFAERFPLYMLLDRLIIWSFCQRNGLLSWNEQWTFREWASHYVLFKPIIDLT
jgi:hygromycin-B 7''-O-kinase